MEPPGEDPTPELSESLRSLAASDALWARLIAKFLERVHAPARVDQPDEIHQA